jgi:hypothetical protein
MRRSTHWLKIHQHGSTSTLWQRRPEWPKRISTESRRFGDGSICFDGSRRRCDANWRQCENEQKRAHAWSSLQRIVGFVNWRHAWSNSRPNWLLAAEGCTSNYEGPYGRSATPSSTCTRRSPYSGIGSGSDKDVVVSVEVGPVEAEEITALQPGGGGAGRLDVEGRSAHAPWPAPRDEAELSSAGPQRPQERGTRPRPGCGSVARCQPERVSTRPATRAGLAHPTAACFRGYRAGLPCAIYVRVLVAHALGDIAVGEQRRRKQARRAESLTIWSLRAGDPSTPRRRHPARH